MTPRAESCGVPPSSRQNLRVGWRNAKTDRIGGGGPGGGKGTAPNAEPREEGRSPLLQMLSRAKRKRSRTTYQREGRHGPPFPAPIPTAPG